MNDEEAATNEIEELQAAPLRTYVNSAMSGTYRTGDGDIFKQPVRPGSEHAFTLPSRGLK